MKKVLIVTYYWPPGGGAGIYRVLKFAKYLPQFGWQPVILTVANGNYPVNDPSLEKDIPVDCLVYKSKSIEPFAVYKKFTGRKKDEKIPDYVFDARNNFKDRISRWVRINLFIPDSRMGWIPSAVRAGLKIIKSENVDLIFSSSPPHTVQVIARRLAVKTGLKWIADFRDPWTGVLTYEGHRRNRLTAALDRRLEKKVLQRADSVICVNQEYIDAFRQQVDNRYFKITNGYDEEDFAGIHKTATAKFRITYTGNLSETRNISGLLSALTNLEPAVRQNIELSFYGFVNQKVQNRIAELHLATLVKFNPYIPHQEAIRQMVNSDILLLVIHESAGNKGMLTGKLYEYARAGNYILALGPKDGEAAGFLEETRSGRIFDYQEDLTGIIRQRYEAWLKKETFKPDTKAVMSYSRKSLTAELAGVFNQALQVKG